MSWFLEFEDTAIAGYQLAAGVPSLRLARADLPHHPLPYEAILRVEARGEGESTSLEWTIVVLPDADALLLPERLP